MNYVDYTPDIIIYNGVLHTVDKKNTILQAVAIKGNIIVATGSDEEVLSLKTERTKLIDAKGCTIMPGIVESHIHMWEAGMLMQGLVTFGIDSIEQLKEQVKLKLEQMKPGEWLQGGGWIESQFKEKRMPTKEDLDEISPNNPVVLERIFSTCVANGAALKCANITKDTKDPKGGEIGRDPLTKEPNGLLFRTAKQLVRDVMPSAYQEDKFGEGKQIEEVIVHAMNDFMTYGITSVVEPGVNPSMIRAYQQLKDSKQLKIRTNLMPNWHGFAINEDESFSDRLIQEYGVYTGFGDEKLRIGGLKMAIDGGLTSKTALKSWPYLNEDKPRDVELRMDVTKLKGWVKQAHDAGWTVGIHVMGDTAIELACNAIYEAYQANPQDRRHQIIHAYFPTEDSLNKMKEANMIAAIQPAFIYNEADGYDVLLPQDKQESFIPIRQYLDHGIRTAMSSDMPSAHHNPFWGVYGAIARKGIQGYHLGNKESATLEECLRMMCIEGAYMTQEEHIKGSIEVGKLADILILDRNIKDTSVEETKDTKVILTMIDGVIEYQRN
ncbi:MAG: amidohydrolase [Erysipelotrichaceae bacterium]